MNSTETIIRGHAEHSARQRTQTILDAALPCPFCGSTDLQYGEWCLQDCDVTPAIECATCYAGAPFEAWQRRAGGDQS